MMRCMKFLDLIIFFQVLGSLFGVIGIWGVETAKRHPFGASIVSVATIGFQ